MATSSGASSVVVVPDFQFSGFYYPELLEDLIQWMRTNVPEITDEEPEEPFIQLLRAFALVGHLNNVLLDLVAKEGYLPTATLRESIRQMLALIDYRLKQATPASADILILLSQTFASAQVPLYPTGATFATQESNTQKAIPFQTLADKSTQRTDRVYACYAYDLGTTTYTDHTAGAQGAGFTPAWVTAPTAGDMLYFGHPDIMWDTIRAALTTPGAGYTGVWEYFDGKFNQGNPDAVVNNGANLTFTLTSFLGTTNRAGSVVRVTCPATGAYEDITSTWNGSANVGTSAGLFGQAIVSTSVANYTLAADWREVPSISDATSGFTAAGTNNASYVLPQAITRKWQTTTVNGLLAYWSRFRVVTTGTTTPVIASVGISSGGQYVLVSATQGTTQADNPLGSSSGLPLQTFQLQQYPVIDDANLIVYVTESIEEPWTRVTDFTASGGTDKQYTLTFDDLGTGTIAFGDGTNGKIPQAGNNNIRAVYRTMDDYNGNVGQNTITVAKSGVPYANNVTNPRAANGYSIREGTTDADLARLKLAGPASLRTKNRALTGDDVVSLAQAFTDNTGAVPFVRALAIEESFGPKTVECVVVGQGGVAATALQLQALQDFFNGNLTTGVKGVLVQNNQATPTNYVQHVINIVATVYGGDQTQIKTALSTLLSPTAVLSDGVTFTWAFGQTVPLALLISTIMGTTPAPRNTVIATPAADVILATRELPVVGSITLTMLP